MKQKIANGLRWIAASRGLPLVVLTVLGMVTVMPGWVKAQSEATTTFTSPLPGGPKGEHGGPNDEIHELLDSIIDRDEILADVLGLTGEELAAAKEAGTSLDELITEAGLTKETVRTAIQTAITAAVEQAVSDGTITQEQADLILTPPARPQHDGHHGPREGGDGPQATPTPTFIATAPAESTPEATTTAATPTAAATTADTAATNGAGDNGNRQRHHNQPSAQNSDTGSASSNASSASTTNSESTSTDTSANNEQATSDRPERGGHQRPGR